MNWTDNKAEFISALNMALYLHSTQQVKLGYERDISHEWLTIYTEIGNKYRIPITNADCIKIMRDIIDALDEEEESL